MVTPGYQKLWVTNSTVFHYPPCPPTGVSWYSLMISALSLLSLDTYTFFSLYMILSTSLYSLSLNIFTPACFIFSTAFTTLLSFTLDCFTSSNKSTSFIMISTFSVLLTLSYSGFTSVLFLLSLSTSTFQSGLLLRLFTFPILLPGTCFNVKSNLNRYNTYFTCL